MHDGTNFSVSDHWFMARNPEWTILWLTMFTEDLEATIKWTTESVQAISDLYQAGFLQGLEMENYIAHCFHGLTPAVKTAEFPPSNISSSSSSVVAFPAVVDTKQKVPHPPRKHSQSGGTLLATHWSPAAEQCVLCSCPGSRLGPRCTWSSPPQTSWPGLRAEGEGRERCHFVDSSCQCSVNSNDFSFVWSWRLLVGMNPCFVLSTCSFWSVCNSLFSLEGNLQCAKTKEQNPQKCCLLM